MNGDAYGIPLPRVIVAVVAAFVFWGILAIELQYAFRGLGQWTSKAFAFAMALLPALLLGVWLMHLTALDGLPGIS